MITFSILALFAVARFPFFLFFFVCYIFDYYKLGLSTAVEFILSCASLSILKAWLVFLSVCMYICMCVLILKTKTTQNSSFEKPLKCKTICKTKHIFKLHCALFCLSDANNNYVEKQVL